MINLWKTLFITSVAFLVPFFLFAETSDPCAMYEIRGIIRTRDKKPVLKFYEGTVSETTMSFDKDLSILSEKYMDRSVLVRAVMEGPILNYRGSLKIRVPIRSPSLKDRMGRDDIQEIFLDPLEFEKNSGVKEVSDLCQEVISK